MTASPLIRIFHCLAECRQVVVKLHRRSIVVGERLLSLLHSPQTRDCHGHREFQTVAVARSGLWIEGQHCPEWVHSKLSSLQFTTIAQYAKNCTFGFHCDSRSVGAGCKGNRVPEQNDYSWTKLMSKHTKCGQYKEALKIYMEMRKKAVRPSTYTFVTILKACSKLRDLQTGKKIHSHVSECGYASNLFVSNTLVDMYAKCGSLVDACEVFEKIPHRNVVSWNAMILAHHKEESAMALEIYARMQREGCKPDSHTFVSVLKACSSLAVQEDGKKIDGMLVKIKSLQKGRAIHTQVSKFGLQSVMFVANGLLDMYTKCGSMVDARHVFDNLSEGDVVSWTALILGYVRQGDGESALLLYSLMQQKGLIPNSRTFVGVLKACTTVQDDDKGANGSIMKPVSLEKGRAIHSDIVKIGLQSDIFVASTLVYMYAKCGSMVDAQLVFDGMLHHNVVSCTALILGYAHSEQGELALQLYTSMRKQGFIPDGHMLVGALKACSSITALESGKQIHSEIRKLGLEGNMIVSSSLLDMYCKCGSMIDAQQLFDSLPAKDLVTWTALITGYSRLGDGDRVFQLFQSMQNEGIQPDSVTFLSILTACSHAGLVNNGLLFFHTMTSKFGITPTFGHYNCMIDLLARAGQLSVAMSMLREMPFKPDPVTWRTLLAACQKWKDVEAVSMHVDRVGRLDEYHSST